MIATDNYDNWSLAKQEGYNDYYDKVYSDNPYNFYEENWYWSQWCDGHMEAYIEDEGK